MEYQDFSNSDYLIINQQCKAPDFIPVSAIGNQLHTRIIEQRHLKEYVLNLLAVDFYMIVQGDDRILFLGNNAAGLIPSRGKSEAYEGEFTPLFQELGLSDARPCIDLSASDLATETFSRMGISPGIAIALRWSLANSERSEQVAITAANFLLAKAEREYRSIMNSKIFLSHRGVDKALVTAVDKTLRLLGLKTWLDTDDLSIGGPLVRAIDAAFNECAAAVFFITKSYADEGIIAQEINRAIHLAATKRDGFKLIPLVLLDHGGGDASVPGPLNAMVWRNVHDYEIVSAIITSLPHELQSRIQFAPLK